MSRFYGTPSDDIITLDDDTIGGVFGRGGNDTVIVPSTYDSSQISTSAAPDEDGNFFPIYFIQYIPIGGDDNFDYRTLYGIENIRFTDGIIRVGDGDPLFDPIYYYEQNPDVYAAGLDAQAHYNEIGWKEGRDPNVFFDTSGYLAAYRDVAAAGINPLDHYRNFGAREGRAVSENGGFDGYLKLNPDLAAADVNPLAHFLETGRYEERPFETLLIGKDIDPDGFDETYYLWKNPDVAASGASARDHYFSIGYLEGRRPNLIFSPSEYFDLNPDVATAGLEPLTHYNDFGLDEGRSTGARYDADIDNYYERRPDVAAAGINPFEHYLEYGIYEDILASA